MTAAATTLRDQQLEAVAGILGELDGWTATRRTPGQDFEGMGAKTAWVTHAGETVLNDDNLTTTKELHVEVLVAVRREALDPLAAENPDRALDLAIAELEAALFGGATAPTPAEVFLEDSWAPVVEQAAQELTSDRALLRFRSRYRHNRGDPFTFNPFYTG